MPHRGHRFKERLTADDPVGLPDRIHASVSHMSIQRQYAVAPENGNSAQPSPIPTPMRHIP
jgi:hypothetical protein